MIIEKTKTDYIQKEKSIINLRLNIDLSKFIFYFYFAIFKQVLLKMKQFFTNLI